jgi:predicted ribosome quality control (RQC) complex YloA/Tae2 family protein
MPIRWDTLMARHTAQELDRALAGARLRAVRLNRATRDLTLLFEERALIWRLHPDRGYLRLHPPVDPVAGDHPVRATLRAVQAPPDERIVRFELSGRSGAVDVAVELMSTRWNAVVTEGERRLVRHLLWRPSRDDRRVAGQPYEPPPPTDRAGADADLPLERWLDALEPLPRDERRRALLRGFAWTSPLNTPALLGESDGPEPDLGRGHARWGAWADPEAVAEPVVLELERGPQPYPFPLPGIPYRHVESLLAAFEACAAADGAAGASPAAVLGPELLARLDRRVDRLSRRVTSLEAELDAVEDPQALRSLGDLILARYHEIPSGAGRARLAGFDGEPVEVELDPSEPLHENAARYYQRATKSERAAERLPGILAGARAEREKLSGLLGRVRAGQADDQEVREMLGSEAEAPAGDGSGPALPYRTFRSSGGLEIRVGRGARHNDDLTFHHCAPDDIWLHARHTAGAHVVLRWPGPGNPPARDLAEAATLAALHSKARTSGSVPVDWTRRKYVRKPRKSSAGQVGIEREQTLFVRPDESLLDRLAD